MQAGRLQFRVLGRIRRVARDESVGIMVQRYIDLGVVIAVVGLLYWLRTVASGDIAAIVGASLIYPVLLVRFVAVILSDPARRKALFEGIPRDPRLATRWDRLVQRAGVWGSWVWVGSVADRIWIAAPLALAIDLCYILANRILNPKARRTHGNPLVDLDFQLLGHAITLGIVLWLARLIAGRFVG